MIKLNNKNNPVYSSVTMSVNKFLNDSVMYSVRYSVLNSVRYSVRYLVYNSIEDSFANALKCYVWYSINKNYD